MSNFLNLSKKLQEVFSLKFINRIACLTKFVQRKSKLSAEKFLALCVFLNDEVCKCSLVELVAELAAKENIRISTEALNERFNPYAVAFMKEIFNETLKNQNEILNNNGKLLYEHFNRIRIADSTEFSLPKEFQDYFRGFYCKGCESVAKIQLEYDLNTGSFLHLDVLDGNSSDASYLSNVYQDIEPKDLHIKDLGYFDTYYFELVAKKEAYFLSRLKRTVNVYEKGHDEKLDIISISKNLAPGEVIEIPKVQVGSKHKVECRLIMTRLTEEQKVKRDEAKQRTLKRKGKKSTSVPEEFDDIGLYILNVPAEILSKELVHDVYSLRWQVEIMFKIWKSIFKIHAAKKVKIERFYCCLYGKLILMLIETDIFYTLKKDAYEKNNIELSEIKGFATIKEFMLIIRNKIFKGANTLYKMILKIKDTILKNCEKSRRKDKKIMTDIIKYAFQ